MPDRCSIPECRAISNRINGKISMFRFPKDLNTRATWLKSIGKKDWIPADKAVICERHFEPSAIMKTPGEDKHGRRWKSKIAMGSLPTILVPSGSAPLPVQVNVRKIRRGKKKKLLEGRKKRGRRRRGEDLDSMPLQQRLTQIPTATAPKEEEKPVPTLKSQSLSPTKLKVTRQSASKSQQPQKPFEEPPKPVTEEICLKWNTHHSNLQTAFPTLLSKEQYCDVTLVAEGRSLKCHKLILSSCSSYFDEVLEKVVPYQHPIIFLKDIPFNILKALCDFMYIGEVNIVQSDLDQILAVGASLKIKGLASRSEATDQSSNTQNDVSEPQKTSVKSNRTKARVSVPEKMDATSDTEITDPLDLMEPTYEEAATPDIPPPVLKRAEPARKSTGRRVRKRKHIEVDHEPSPPVFRMRKGTRSRPNIKVPRYFNANFDNSVPVPAVPEPSEYSETIQTEESYMDSYLNILDHIKTEPLDIEDGSISFEEEAYVPEAPTLEPEVPEAQKIVKKRRLSRNKTKLEKLDRTDRTEENLEENSENPENSDRRRILENSDIGDEEKRQEDDLRTSENSEPAEMENCELGEIENSDPGENENRESPEIENGELGEIENTEPAENENSESPEIENTEPGEIENSDPGENENCESPEIENSELGEVENSDLGEIENNEPAESRETENSEPEGIDNSEVGEIENSERAENPMETSYKEDEIVENEHEEKMEVENSDMEETQKNSDKEREENGSLGVNDEEQLQMENHQLENEPDIVTNENEMETENSDERMENNIGEDSNEENSEEKTGYHEIRIENSYTDVTEEENSENQDNEIPENAECIKALENIAKEINAIEESSVSHGVPQGSDSGEISSDGILQEGRSTS